MLLYSMQTLWLMLLCFALFTSNIVINNQRAPLCKKTSRLQTSDCKLETQLKPDSTW